MVWGGLRGSVGLALALVVFHTSYDHDFWGGEKSVEFADDTLLCRDIPRDVLMMTCVVVLSTVVVNGSSVAWIIHKIGLDKLPEDRLLMLGTSHDLFVT